MTQSSELAVETETAREKLLNAARSSLAILDPLLHGGKAASRDQLQKTREVVEDAILTAIGERKVSAATGHAECLCGDPQCLSVNPAVEAAFTACDNPTITRRQVKQILDAAKPHLAV